MNTTSVERLQPANRKKEREEKGREERRFAREEEGNARARGETKRDEGCTASGSEKKREENEIGGRGREGRGRGREEGGENGCARERRETSAPAALSRSAR